MVKGKRYFIVIIVLILCVFALTVAKKNSNKAVKNEEYNEEYYMVTFLDGLDYWKGCYKGFNEAGNRFGVKTIYTGSVQYDINQEITVLEQVIAKKPAGIAVTCINSQALRAPIKKAIEQGIPVVTFDADAPNSGRYSFIATDNEEAGAVAARTLAKEVGDDGGEIAIITLPSQLNHEQRISGFKKTLEKEFGSFKISRIGNGNGDQVQSAKVLSGFLQDNPNIKGVFCTDSSSGLGAAVAVKEANKVGEIKIVSFDTDKGTLDAIKSGVISASIAQGTYKMGTESLEFLYKIKHGQANSNIDNKENILPTYVDTGVIVVTKKNLENFIETIK